MSDLVIENKTTALGLVTEVSNIYGNINLLRALQGECLNEWDSLFDANTEEHLIQNVRLATTKSDAVRTYIAKALALYTRSGGNSSTAWTRFTICSDNSTNIAIINKVTSEMIRDHNHLFKIIASRIMGFDDILIDAAIDTVNESIHLVNYLVGKYNLNELDTSSDEGKILEGVVTYPELAEVFDYFKDNPLTQDVLLRMYHSALHAEKVVVEFPMDPMDLLTEVFNDTKNSLELHPEE